MTDAVLTLQEAADELGVHYMTAYRYVRLGVMEASKSGGIWQVQRSALDRFRAEATEAAAATGPSGKGGPRNRKAPWSARLEARLVAGDAPGCWSVVEAAMTAGAELDEIYLDVLTPAMVSIGERWAKGELDEFHALPVAMRGDLLRLRGWEVSDFGVDVPRTSIVHVIRATPDLLAVGLSAMSSDNLVALGEACVAAREADPEVLVVVGGHAVVDDEQALALGAHARAASSEAMHELLLAHAAVT